MFESQGDRYCCLVGLLCKHGDCFTVIQHQLRCHVLHCWNMFLVF